MNNVESVLCVPKQKIVQLVAETTTRQHTTLTTTNKKIHATGGIRSQNFRLYERTAADQRLKTLGYRDW
jgi:hypothetical protein